MALLDEINAGLGREYLKLLDGVPAITGINSSIQAGTLGFRMYRSVV